MTRLKRKKRGEKTAENLALEFEQAQKRNQLFMTVWSKRPHTSEVSGTFLGITPKTLYFHHILPKSKYPDLEFEEENIILLTGDEHASVEMNMNKYEEVNKRREKLKTKFNIK